MAATLPPSSSLLSRTRSGRVPSSRAVMSHAGQAGYGQAGHGQNGHGHAPTPPTPTSASFPSTSAAPASINIPLPTSSVAIFLSNLRLLDLDRRPDWPGITARTFSAKDASQGQKKRIQSVEWALYHLFCLWDSHADDVRKMHALFPPADQVQSVNLRAALLRGLEQAKKTGALGRDAILRKTMLDECRGERFEEVLAVFSSAVLRREADRNETENASAALALALEQRGYSAERTQLNGLVLAHKASLAQKLRRKDDARARYRDFAELLALKARTLARRRELEAQLAEEESNKSATDDTRRQLQRLVQNNWAGSDQWMDALLYGDERARKDGLLSTAPDRVWRRVQAGRLGELGELDSDSAGSAGSGGLLSQLDRRVGAQKQRLQHWDEYSRRILGRPLAAAPVSAETVASKNGNGNGREPAEALPKRQKTGIDLGFGAHDTLYPQSLTASPRKGATRPTPVSLAPPHSDDYANLLQSFQDELAGAGRPRQNSQTPLASFLQARKASAKAKPGHGRREQGRSAEASAGSASNSEDAEAAEDAEDFESEISDIEEHPIVQQLQEHLLEQQQRELPLTPLHQQPHQHQLYLQQPLSAGRSSVGPTSEDSNSPTRRRVLLTKSSMTFSVRSFHSDDEPEPDLHQALHQALPPLPQAVRKLSGQLAMAGDGPSLAFRTRQQSPPIRSPRARAAPAMLQMQMQQQQMQQQQQQQQVVRTPSPDRSPPPPSPSPPSPPERDAYAYGTPHSITVHPPDDTRDDALSPGSAASPTQDLADQIMASMSNASPSPMKRPRHRLSLAQRTRMSMGVWDDEVAEQAPDPADAWDTLAIRRQDTRKEREAEAAAEKEAQSVRDKAAGYEDLVARTRRSMAGFEASRQKAQLERRRSQRMRPSLAPVKTEKEKLAAATAPFDSIEEDASVLADELIGQDDAEAIFRSRPKIKMSPIPSPTRELEY